MTSGIFNVEWTTGNLSMPVVSVIAKYLGIFSAAIISIVGFGIVWSTILKNATHGLYATNPKFWDRVNEVKKAGIRNGEAAGKVAGGSNNEVMKLLGSVTSVLMSVLPNVKAMTDFDDELLDAKAYFMKAIPLMCINIFVGVFIFFGYPAQVAEKFSDFGRGMFDVVLTNVDPHQWVEALPDKLAILRFATDGSMNDFDKRVNKVSKKVANTYVTALSDMTKEARQNAALHIEQWVSHNMQDSAAYVSEDKYDMTVTSTVYKTGQAPDLSHVHGVVTNGVATFAYYTPMTEIPSGLEHVEEINSWFIRYDLKFTPKAQKGLAVNSDVTLKVPSSNFVPGDKEIEITVTTGDTSGYGIETIESARAMAVKSNGSKVEVNVSYVAGKLIMKVNESSSEKLNSVVQIDDIQGVAYYYLNSRNSVKKIAVGGNAVEFVTESGKSWRFGEDPAGNSNSTNDSLSNDEESDNSQNENDDNDGL